MRGPALAALFVFSCATAATPKPADLKCEKMLNSLHTYSLSQEFTKCIQGFNPCDTKTNFLLCANMTLTMCKNTMEVISFKTIQRMRNKKCPQLEQLKKYLSVRDI